MARNDSHAALKKQTLSSGPVSSTKDGSPTPSAEKDALSGDPNFMTSLAPGLAVIQSFAERKHQFAASQLSQKTGFSPAVPT